jgi:GntR family transcriptional regulator, rspAB operon transcriptional repressor
VFPVQSKRSLGEQAYEQIREAIITLQFKPGQMVYESDLGAQLGMSRTPIREAIHMLSVEDLIEVLPQRGMRVTLVSGRKVEEVRFVRESLEMSAWATLATLWNSSERQYRSAANAVQQILEEQKIAAETGDMLRFMYLDEAFHRTVLELCGNQTLTAVVTQLRGHLNRVRVLGLYGATPMETLIEEHERLFQLLTRNDVVGMTSLLTHHLRRLCQDLIPLKMKFGDYFETD